MVYWNFPCWHRQSKLMPAHESMCWCVAKWEKRRHELDDRLALSVVVDDMTRRNNVSVRRSSPRMYRKKIHDIMERRKKRWTSNYEPIHQADFMPMKHSIWMTSIRLICRLSKVDALVIDIAREKNNNRSPAARRRRTRSAKKATALLTPTTGAEKCKHTNPTMKFLGCEF